MTAFGGGDAYPRLRRQDRIAVVGVLNVTPDSFSDGGRFVGGERGSRVDVEAAIAHGIRLHAEGADLVDVGGESTRPGAHRISAEEERRRVLPVIRELAADGLACSVDTTRAEVAEAALDAGATVVNDVSGGLADPGMAKLVSEVRAELEARVAAAVDAGVDIGNLVIDPGLGFAKRAEHNWALLRNLSALMEVGLPMLVGASRKNFLGRLLADDGELRPPGGREIATASISALVAAAGVWGIRVHDVAASRDAVLVGGAWRDGHA
jgi:dihydropteroate synthase